MPAEDLTAPGEILLPGGSEFEPQSVRERPDLIEPAIDRFAKRIASLDGDALVARNRFSSELSKQTKQGDERFPHFDHCWGAP